MCIFVDVEGIDGVGKSTVIRLAADELRRRGYLVYVTSEPSDSPIGLFIRRNILEGNLEVEPMALALLFAADRVIHYNRVIKPKVQEGYIVITERYIESSIAYQGSQGVPIEWIIEVNSMVAKPDLVILLNAPLSTVVGRLTSREALEYFERSINFLRGVQEVYLKRARELNYPIVDASRLINNVVNDVLTLIEDKAKDKCKGNNQ